MSAQPAIIQSQLDFSAKARKGALEGGKRFREVADRKLVCDPGEAVAVTAAIVEVMELHNHVHADLVRLHLQQSGDWAFLKPGRHVLGCMFGSLARRKILLRDGYTRSSIPANKGREIKTYIRGRNWDRLAPAGREARIGNGDRQAEAPGD